MYRTFFLKKAGVKIKKSYNNNIVIQKIVYSNGYKDKS